MRKIAITRAQDVRIWIGPDGWLNIEVDEKLDAAGGVLDEVYDDGGLRQRKKWGVAETPDVPNPLALPVEAIWRGAQALIKAQKILIANAAKP